MSKCSVNFIKFLYIQDLYLKIYIKIIKFFIAWPMVIEFHFHFFIIIFLIKYIILIIIKLIAIFFFTYIWYCYQINRNRNSDVPYGTSATVQYSIQHDGSKSAILEVMVNPMMKNLKKNEETSSKCCCLNLYL